MLALVGDSGVNSVQVLRQLFIQNSRKPIVRNQKWQGEDSELAFSFRKWGASLQSWGNSKWKPLGRTGQTGGYSENESIKAKKGGESPEGLPCCSWGVLVASLLLWRNPLTKSRLGEKRVYISSHNVHHWRVKVQTRAVALLIELQVPPAPP